MRIVTPPAWRVQRTEANLVDLAEAGDKSQNTGVRNCRPGCAAHAAETAVPSVRRISARPPSSQERHAIPKETHNDVIRWPQTPDGRLHVASLAREAPFLGRVLGEFDDQHGSACRPTRPTKRSGEDVLISRGLHTSVSEPRRMTSAPTRLRPSGQRTSLLLPGSTRNTKHHASGKIRLFQMFFVRVALHVVDTPVHSYASFTGGRDRKCPRRSLPSRSIIAQSRCPAGSPRMGGGVIHGGNGPM